MIVYNVPKRLDPTGKTWCQLISDVSFTEDGSVWAVGSGQVLKSINRGLTWTNLYDALPEGNGLVPSRVFAIDEHRCWFVAAISLTGQKGCYTQDGGLTWKLFCFDETLNPNALLFLNSMKGWAVGDDAKIPVRSSYVYATEDGGAIWKLRSTLSKGKARSVKFFNPSDGLLLLDELHAPDNCYKSKLCLSIDGGYVWTPVYEFGRQVLGFYCLDSRQFFATGEDGWLARSRDGGSSWQRISTKRRANLNSVSFYQSRFGAAAGDSANLFVSKDAGWTWEAVALPHETNNLIAARFTTERDVVLVGENSIHSINV